MSDEPTGAGEPGDVSPGAADGAPKKRKKAPPDRTPHEWEQLAKVWRAWNPEPADAGPDSLRKALFKIVDIAIKRSGEARTALDVNASEWLAWLELPGNTDPPAKIAPPTSGPVADEAPVAPAASTPVSAPVPERGSAPAPAAVPSSPPAPPDAVLQVAKLAARRLEELDTTLRRSADAIRERQESVEEAGRRVEQSLTHATRGLPAIAGRIEELERSSRAMTAAVRDLQAGATVRQERAEVELRQLIERELGSIRSVARAFGDSLDERLRSKVDLADVSRLLDVQQHVEERVQADMVRRASRRIAPALDALRVALAEGDGARTKSAFDELCTACRTAGLVLDLTQIF